MRFSAFKRWALDSGYRVDLIIDRRNNAGNYTPENCRWISIEQSNRNKRTVLDAESVARIRECVLFGAKQTDLAKIHGKSDAAISLLVNGVTFQ